MKTFLFQGDSITDAGRTGSRDPNSSKGMGYPLLVESKLRFDYPNDYEFINRGISGNKITDIIARIKRDKLLHDLFHLKSRGACRQTVSW